MFNIMSATSMELNGSLIFRSAGQKVHVKNGPNASFGTGTLSTGSSNVPTTNITAASLVFVSDMGAGVLANLGALQVSGIRSGSGFTVQSANLLDSSNFAWWIIEPSP